MDDVSTWRQIFNFVFLFVKRWFDLVPWHLEHILQAQWFWIAAKLLQKHEVTFSDDVLTVVGVVFALDPYHLK